MMQSVVSRMPSAAIKAVQMNLPATSILARNIVKASYSCIAAKKDYVKFNRNVPNHIQGQTRALVTEIAMTAGAVSVLGAVFVGLRYKVAQANEWIIKTGPFVDDVDISKQTLILPFQEYTKVNMNPRTLKTVVNAMTTEKIPFNMPMTFTICPIDNPVAIKKWSVRMCGVSTESCDENLLGIIQGESRILTAEMELEKLFNDRDTFKHQMTDKINGLLEEFGLRAMNINIEELIDNDGSEYFKYMKKKALEKAVNKARVDVAEQTKEGDIGEKEHVRTSRKKLAEIEADAVSTENEKQREILSSMTELDIAKSNFEKSRQIAAYQAKAEAEMKQIEYQQIVEEKRRAQKIEEIRAVDYSAAMVAAEVKTKDMEGVMAAEKHKAETEAHIAVIQAKAQLEKQKFDAEAQLYLQQKEAEAHLYHEQKSAEAYLLARAAEADGIALLRAAEAKGIEQVKLAEARGLEQLILASGGNVESLSKYLMITNGTIVDVAKEQANSLQNMKPTIWVNGGSNGGNNLSDTMQDIMRNAVPLNDAIKAQTGVDFLGTLNVKRVDNSNSSNSTSAEL